MIIRKDFKSLIPELSDDEFSLLEESILKEGCRDALIMWGEVLVDGHNRHAICTKHGIDFKERFIDFEDVSDATQWIIYNQFARRNLSLYERAKLALRLESEIAKKAKEKQREAGGAVSQKSDKPVINTKIELAKSSGVSHDTIMRVKKIEALATPETKKKIEVGDVSINKVFSDIKREEKREQITKEIIAKKESPKLSDMSPPSLILADPPWRYEFSETKKRDIENHYPTATIEEIKAHTPTTQKDCVLFLWATVAKLPEAFEIMEGWGFTYKTLNCPLPVNVLFRAIGNSFRVDY